MKDTICLYVSIPIACFRAPYARTFAESLPLPAPSTVYGMLLSMVGEKDRYQHTGTYIAVGLINDPEHSIVLRKMWKIKQNYLLPGLNENAGPGHQELLIGTELYVWINKGEDNNEVPLYNKIQNAFSNPKSVQRFGSLCLGESTHLVNDIRYSKKTDKETFQLLKPVDLGDLSLPIWPDHVGSFTTKWKQFVLEERSSTDINETDFIKISDQ